MSEKDISQSEGVQLDECEKAILALEKKRWKYPGAKEQAIREELGLGAIAYYQRLNAMIDNPRIIAVEPALTRRLREHRDGGNRPSREHF